MTTLVLESTDTKRFVQIYNSNGVVHDICLFKEDRAYKVFDSFIAPKELDEDNKVNISSFDTTEEAAKYAAELVMRYIKE